MNSRYNKTERIGINRIAQICEEDLDWIFREQSVADVGIDAIVENCSGGIPSGKFLALQIKSGKGNVYKSKDGLVYYISNIHYYYWINLDLPVLLLCYIPEQKIIYWQIINKSTVTKTPNSWKVVLPFSHKFNLEGKNELNNIILKSKNKRLSIEGGDSTTEPAKIEYLRLVTDSIYILSSYEKYYAKRIDECSKNVYALKKMVNDNERSMKKEILTANLVGMYESFASRVFNETHIFSSLFAQAISAFKANLELANNLSTEYNYGIDFFDSLSESFMEAIETTKSFKRSMGNVKKAYPLISKQVDKAILSLTTIINEFIIAKMMIDNLRKAK